MFDHKETLRQLTQCREGVNPTSRLMAMLGTEMVVYDNKKCNVAFDIHGARKTTMCRITLNGKDLYDMEFLKKKRGVFEFGMETVKKFEDLMCDQLKDVFEEFTGLRLSLY